MSSKLISDEATTTGSVIMRDALRRPLHDLRISVLDQCNFRCPYCMPEDEYHADFEFLKKQQRLTYEEILKIARDFPLAALTE